jgi:metal-dependent hydrolase (beta-lactamase superfamily II)
MRPGKDPTIGEMEANDPDYVARTHCTGWKAVNRLAQKMPERFLLISVGTTYVVH